MSARTGVSMTRMAREAPEKARERMRRLRAKHGGMTPADLARDDAVRELIEQHREEFDDLRQQAYNRRTASAAS